MSAMETANDRSKLKRQSKWKLVMFGERELCVGCLDERTAISKIIKLRIIFSFILINSIDIVKWCCFCASFSHKIVDLASL